MMVGPVLYQDRAMKQITFAPRNHLLTNTNTWTPDSQWLVFDDVGTGDERKEFLSGLCFTINLLMPGSQCLHVW